MTSVVSCATAQPLRPIRSLRAYPLQKTFSNFHETFETLLQGEGQHIEA